MIPDIKSVEDEATELKTYWQQRDSVIRSDRLLYNLIKPQAKTNQSNWTLNAPKVLWDTSASLLSAYPARYRMPLTINYTGEEKTRMSKAERLCIGINRNLDYKQMGMGRKYWLAELAWWICSGWFCIYPEVRMRNGQVEFIADCLDPLTVYPEWDADQGLTGLVRCYDTSPAAARKMAQSWGITWSPKLYTDGSIKQTIVLINWWRKVNDKVYNAILLDGTPVKPVTDMNMKEIPFIVGAVGVPEKDSKDWTTRWGESVIAANRDMFDYLNRIFRMRVQILAKRAYPNVATTTESGEPAVQAEDYAGVGKVIALKQGESINTFEDTKSPSDIDTLTSQIETSIQRGGLPYVVYGGLPFELSGFAISQLMAAIQYKVAPYRNTLMQVVSTVFSNLLNQYKEGNFPPIKLATKNPTELKKGLFFVEEFKPSDVPESLFIEVNVPMTSALDKTQQITYARQAMAAPQLVSRETLWDDVLDIQDSDQEYARIIQDQVLEMPIVKQIAMVEKLNDLVKKYKDAGNFVAAEALDRYVKALEVQLGMRQSQVILPGQENTPGMSPEMMPPEMSGNNPDMMRAAQNVGPPGVNRRTQMPAERKITQGGGALI